MNLRMAGPLTSSLSSVVLHQESEQVRGLAEAVSSAVTGEEVEYIITSFSALPLPSRIKVTSTEVFVCVHGRGRWGSRLTHIIASPSRLHIVGLPHKFALEKNK